MAARPGTASSWRWRPVRWSRSAWWWGNPRRRRSRRCGCRRPAAWPDARPRPGPPAAPAAPKRPGSAIADASSRGGMVVAAPDAAIRTVRLRLRAQSTLSRFAQTSRAAWYGGRMCRSAHNRKTVAIPRGSAGASDLDPSSSSSTSPTVAPQNDALVALGAVFLLLAMGFSALGSDPWSFNPGTVRADGALGWVVRLAGSRWDVGLLQAGIVVALAAVSAVEVVVARGWQPRAATLLAIVMLACACAVLPAVVLQVALREGT